MNGVEMKRRVRDRAIARYEKWGGRKRDGKRFAYIYGLEFYDTPHTHTHTHKHKHRHNFAVSFLHLSSGPSVSAGDEF